MVTLVDSYSEANRSADASIGALHPSSSGTQSARGNSFTCGTTCKITSAKFYLKKVGSPTGNAHAVLYAHTGTYGTNSKPTGSPLATSEDFDVSTLTASYQLITFTFTGAQQYEMQASTYYCIVYENPTAGTMGGGNSVFFGSDNTSPTHDGNACYFWFSAWQSSSTRDSIFYVYGETAPPPLVEVPMGFNFRMGMRGGLGRPPLGTGGCSIGG